MPPTPCRFVLRRSTIPSPSTSVPGPDALNGSTAIVSAAPSTARPVERFASRAPTNAATPIPSTVADDEPAAARARRRWSPHAAQRRPECRHVGITTRGVDRHRTGDHLIENRRHLGASAARLWAGSGQGLDNHGLRRRTVERRRPGEHLVEHAAQAYWSDRASTSCAAACSGLMYVRRADREAGAWVSGPLGAGVAARAPCATPKSATMAWPAVSRMFSGLMSRWTTPCACA